jgi:hypothetical protein
MQAPSEQTSLSETQSRQTAAPRPQAVMLLPGMHCPSVEQQPWQVLTSHGFLPPARTVRSQPEIATVTATNIHARFISALAGFISYCAEEIVFSTGGEEFARHR